MRDREFVAPRAFAASVLAPPGCRSQLHTFVNIRRSRAFSVVCPGTCQVHWARVRTSGVTSATASVAPVRFGWVPLTVSAAC
jgi:hypothetical protein